MDTQILTYKIKHNRNFNEELQKAKLIANFVIENKDTVISSKHVSQFKLKSAISCQIIRKYKKRKIKEAKSVKLTIPNQHIKVDKENKIITITCINLALNYKYLRTDFNKINQIEIDNTYVYISMDINCQEQLQTNDFLGIDLNVKSHCAVVAIPKNKKVIKLGKSAQHIHNKYSKLRRQMQKAKQYSRLKLIKKKERNKIKDLNHKISRKITELATENNCHIRLENLKGIRKTTKQNKSFRYSINSWNFYSLARMIEYKTKMCGIQVEYVNPKYTSQTCSRCGKLGKRKDKVFHCTSCEYLSHADVNAAFNIAYNINKTQLDIEQDISKGNTDIPNRTCPIGAMNLRTLNALA